MFTLRPARVSDAQALFRLCWSDPTVMHYQAFPRQTEPSQAVNRLKAFLDGWQTGDDFYWVMARFLQGKNPATRHSPCHSLTHSADKPNKNGKGIYTHSPNVGQAAALPAVCTGDRPVHFGRFGSGVLGAQLDDGVVDGHDHCVSAVDTLEELVGCIMLSKDGEYQYNVGYSVGKAFWGQGYATQAVKLTSHWAFETLHATAVHGYCFRDNRASIRVLKKLGFQYKQTLFNSHPLPNLELGIERVMYKYTLCAKRKAQ